MTTRSPLVLATGNAGKVEELRALLADLDLTLLPAGDLDASLSVVADPDTLPATPQK